MYRMLISSRKNRKIDSPKYKSAHNAAKIRSPEVSAPQFKLREPGGMRRTLKHQNTMPKKTQDSSDAVEKNHLQTVQQKE